MRVLDTISSAVFAIGVATAVGSITLAGCRSDGGKRQGAMPAQDIKTVMEAHVDELMAIPGVTAVAIGALEDGTPCVKVYVVESNEETKRKIPATLEGHPVVVEVSGEIKPMGS